MNDESIGKVVFIILGVIVIGMVVAFGISAFRTANDKGASTISELENSMNSISESKYTDYEGKTISGMQVQSLVEQYNGDEVFVKVITNTNTTMYNYSSEDLSTAIAYDTNNTNIANCSIKGKANYINPNRKFECTITRDQNSTILGITFKQK